MQIHFEYDQLPKYPYKEFRKESKKCTKNLSHCSMEELRSMARKESEQTKILGYLDEEASGRLVDMSPWTTFAVAERNSLLFCTPGGIVVEV